MGFFARPCRSRRIAGIGCDNTTELAIAPDRVVTNGPEIDLQHIVPDIPTTMRALDILVAHPSPQNVIELDTAEADEEIQAFALDSADEGFCEGVCVGYPVRDLDHPNSLRRPDGIKASAELGAAPPIRNSGVMPCLSHHIKVLRAVGSAATAPRPERGVRRASGRARAYRSRAWPLPSAVDIMPAFLPDAQQFGFFGKRQDDPFHRDEGPKCKRWWSILCMTICKKAD